MTQEGVNLVEADGSVGQAARDEAPGGGLNLRNKLLVIGAGAVALIGAHNLISPNIAEADCQTTSSGGTTYTTCSTTENCTTTQENNTSYTSCSSSQPSTESPPAVTPTPAGQGGHKPKPKPHHKPHHRQQHTIFDYYRNPLRAVKHGNGGVYARRIDEGVDYRGHGPVKAIGTAVVTVVKKHSSSFWAAQGGNVVVYELENGPAAGKKVFVSENCTPTVHEHETVYSNTTVCFAHDSRPNIETGWATNSSNYSYVDRPAAWPYYTHAGNPDGSKMAYGVNFSQLMGLLGAPEGNTNHAPGDVSVNPSRTLGPLPTSYPRWSLYK